MKKRLLATIPVLLVVFLCSANVFAYVNPIKQVSTNAWYAGTTPNVSVYATATQLYGTADITNSNMTQNAGTQDVVVNVRITNFNDYAVSIGGINIKVYDGTSTNHNITSFDIIYGNVSVTFGGVYSNDSVSFLVYPNTSTNHMSDSGYAQVVVPARSNIAFAFTYSTYYSSGSSSNSTIDSIRISCTSITFGGFDSGVDVNYTELFDKLEELLTDGNGNTIYELIHDAYNNNSGLSQSVTSESNSLETQSDTIHSQETGYYTQTNTALANTGLSNYQFSSDVVGGMGKVKDQFTYVWNKIGNYNVVYVFSLTLSIALMIIRHVRPIRRKQEE